MENDFRNELVRPVPREGGRGGWRHFEMGEGGIGGGRANGGQIGMRMWWWRESLREWRVVVFRSRVRDRVLWFGIVMNTMVGCGVIV